MNEDQQVNFVELHEEWVEKRALLDQLTAQHVAPPTEDSGTTIEMPREMLSFDVIEELQLARANETEAWERLVASLRNPASLDS